GNRRGQSLVMMVFAVSTIAIAVAVTIDGGNAFAQQRAVQNGSDAAALAGAVELGNLGSCSINGCTGPTDAQIHTEVVNAATANAVTVSNAYYTDVCGVPLTVTGTAAASDLSNAAQVGGGTI